MIDINMNKYIIKIVMQPMGWLRLIIIIIIGFIRYVRFLTRF